MEGICMYMFYNWNYVTKAWLRTQYSYYTVWVLRMAFLGLSICVPFNNIYKATLLRINLVRRVLVWLPGDGQYPWWLGYSAMFCLWGIRIQYCSRIIENFICYEKKMTIMNRTFKTLTYNDMINTLNYRTFTLYIDSD